MTDGNSVKFELGDMTVVGRWPAKLMKALAVISKTLHPVYDAEPWIAHPGKSKESCILASLTVRDFLISIGFADATVRSVSTVMRAEKAGVLLHSLGIGCPAKAYGTREIIDEPGRWNGHMVATVPSVRCLIDTTLYPTVRPAWDDFLPGMIALPYGTYTSTRKLFGCRPIAGIDVSAEDDYQFAMVYLDRPENTSWKRGGDTEPWRRVIAGIEMREQFGEWRE